MPLDNAPPADGRSSELHRRLQVALGRDYELGAPLGRGGFAEVFVAWDRRLKREVAVKTVRGELFAAPEMLERFRRETEAIGRLRHPHIVPVYSVGEGEGVAYFIMPRIRGESLAEAMQRETRWGFSEVVRVLREAAGALAEAHRHGIVHRDIKPENIMVDGPERRVVVMDFGIAKSLDDTTAGGGLTGTGMLVGTPHYMSPEQAAGDGVVDHLSDQYSLAMVGYRLLTGRLPFDADSMRSVLFQQAAGVMTPITELRPDIPAPLARILERALDKERSHRFASMDDFADALRGVAGEIAGEFRVGRSFPPLAERWVAVRQALVGHSRRFAVAGVLGAIAFVAALPHAEPARARKAAAARAEAAFVAKGWLAENGGAPDLVVRHDFVNSQPLFSFVQRAIPRDSLEARLSRDVGIWSWESAFYSPRTQSSRWATVSPRQEITTFWIQLPSSSGKIADGGDSAAIALEQQTLQHHGWKPTDVTLTRRNVYPDERYTTRLTSWDVPARALVAGTDTARYKVSLNIIGAQVTRYEQGWILPKGGQAGISTSTRRSLFAASIVAMMAAFFAALALAAKRSVRDTMQWRMAATLGTSVLVISLATIILPRIRHQSVPIFAFESTSRLYSGISWIMDLAPELLGFWLSTTLFLLVAESLLNEKRPDLAAGLDDLSRGRFLIPELVPSAVAGYGVGFAVLGAGFTAAAALHRFTSSPLPSRLYQAWAFEIAFPVLGVASVVPLALWLCALAYFYFAITTALRLPFAGALAVLFAGLTFGLYQLSNSAAPEMRVVLEGMAFMPVAWLLQRRGFIAALIAALVIFGSPVAADLVWAGGDLFFTSGVLGFGLILGPGAAAVMIWRRNRRRLG